LRGLLEISEIEAGLQTVAWLPDGMNGVEAAEAAAKRGVEVVPLSRYAQSRKHCLWSAGLSPAREGLQLGFAAIGPEEIKIGVRELAKALEELAGSRRKASSANTSA
jgi:GntR family transcriptional regulator/MocR family aminotransferase